MSPSALGRGSAAPGRESHGVGIAAARTGRAEDALSHASTTDDGSTQSPPGRRVGSVPEDSVSEASLPRGSTGGTGSSRNALRITSAPNESEHFKDI
jgi:hypothetical protein